MNVRSFRWRAWLGAGLLALMIPGHAAAQAEAPGEALDLSGISYLSGGIGSDEAEAMKAQASHHALALTFAQHTDGQDVYLASVPVVISKDDGTQVLDIVTEGPYLLINLPEGRYHIAATHRQQAKTAEVTIQAGTHVKRTFLWEVAEPVAAPSRPALPVVTSPATSALPDVQTWQGVRYLTGGIGSDESSAIKAEFSRYALSITLASRRDGKDVFLADVPVVIRDAAGTVVLEATTDGPYLLADLSPGRYQVSATYGGEEKRAQTQVVAGKPSRLVFLWLGAVP